MNGMKPLVVHGKIIPDYYVAKDGYIWSFLGKTPKRMSGKPDKTGYVKTSVKYNGEFLKTYFHRASAFAWVPFPRPKSISKAVWESLPEEVKFYIKSLHSVNHIDHDRGNFHPSNLEWVTARGNALAYQEFIRED